MNTGLCEISPASFVRRTVLLKRKPIAAIVAPPDQVKQTAEEVRETLNELAVRFADATLDGGLRVRCATVRRTPTDAVVVASTSEDEELWRAVERHRSRLEDGATTMLVLSEGAARALQRTAPNLVSLIGEMWEAAGISDPAEGLEPKADVEPRLVGAIAKARAGRYPALYESAPKHEENDLDEAIEQIVAALGDPRLDDQAWRRIGFMGRAMVIEVLPTIAAHWPAGLAVANAVREALDTWLSSSRAPTPPARLLVGPVVPQAVAEAIDVVQNAARLMDRARASAALAELLDSVFQGYAIFPGKEGRRALFDWWLDEVVPAAATLRTPLSLSPRFRSASPHG